MTKGYKRKVAEELGLYDRVAIQIEPNCPAAISLHGFHHKVVNELTGTITRLDPHPPHTDHKWFVRYDQGLGGWHTPAELRDFIADFLEEHGAA